MTKLIDSLRRGLPAGLEELAQLGRTLWHRRADILAYFDYHASNGPTEARFPDQPERQLCIESIYQAIYDPRTDLTRPAKRRRRRRRHRVQGLQRRGRLTAMTMIADRPTEVADRVQVGH